MARVRARQPPHLTPRCTSTSARRRYDLIGTDRLGSIEAVVCCAVRGRTLRCTLHAVRCNAACAAQCLMCAATVRHTRSAGWNSSRHMQQTGGPSAAPSAASAVSAAEAAGLSLHGQVGMGPSGEHVRTRSGGSGVSFAHTWVFRWSTRTAGRACRAAHRRQSPSQRRPTGAHRAEHPPARLQAVSGHTRRLPPRTRAETRTHARAGTATQRRATTLTKTVVPCDRRPCRP